VPARGCATGSGAGQSRAITPVRRVHRSIGHARRRFAERARRAARRCPGQATVTCWVQRAVCQVLNVLRAEC